MYRRKPYAVTTVIEVIKWLSILESVDIRRIRIRLRLRDWVINYLQVCCFEHIYLFWGGFSVNFLLFNKFK